MWYSAYKKWKIGSCNRLWQIIMTILSHKILWPSSERCASDYLHNPWIVCTNTCHRHTYNSLSTQKSQEHWTFLIFADKIFLTVLLWWQETVSQLFCSSIKIHLLLLILLLSLINIWWLDINTIFLLVT